MALAFASKDDVRFGRLVQDVTEKMPKSSDPKTGVIFVQDLLEDLVEDARINLFGREGEEFGHDESGDLCKVREYNDGQGRWCDDNACPLAGVIVAWPEPDWRYCGPIRKTMFVNPARETEARRPTERWPMQMRHANGCIEGDVRGSRSPVGGIQAPCKQKEREAEEAADAHSGAGL
jgi:hypothetical protein